jgi:hypothetical protein
MLSACDNTRVNNQATVQGVRMKAVATKATSALTAAAGLRTIATVLAAVLVLTGCNTVNELFRGGPREQSRVRSDVTEYACADGKTLSLKMDPAAKAAWVVSPEREYRLDAVAGASDRYSNGRTTLTLRDGQASLEETGAPAGTAALSGCKRR